jgi:2-polyprenyl-6-hydroxyphenyl methylase/3-demethylubiquinone-9 3-methyltransferase
MQSGQRSGANAPASRILQPSSFGPLLCPDCRRQIDLAGLRCACGLGFEYRDGVLRLLGRAFGRELRAFTAIFSAIRQAQGKRLLAPTAYPLLPGGPAVRGQHEWRLRRYDLALARRLLRGRGVQRILDVGAWNGWLSNRLARDGHDVTAVDYFDDPLDGLGARQFYGSDWRAIQLDITDLGVLNERYDLAIVNRCLQFAGDPAGFVAHVAERVAPGGTLLLTGLHIFRDARRKAAEVARMQQQHRERFGVELFLRPTKGYLDADDSQMLRASGFSLRPYGRLAVANARALLSPQRPLHLYAIREAID